MNNSVGYDRPRPWECVKPLSGVGYVRSFNTHLSHSRQWFNIHFLYISLKNWRLYRFTKSQCLTRSVVHCSRNALKRWVCEQHPRREKQLPASLWRREGNYSSECECDTHRTYSVCLACKLQWKPTLTGFGDIWLTSKPADGFNSAEDRPSGTAN